MNSTKFEEARKRLITVAQRVAGDYVFHKFGSAHLIGDPKVELTSTEGPTSSSFVFQGRITCYAASDGLLNQVGINMTVNENNIEVEGTEDVEAKIEQALNTAENQSETVVASLDSFKLTAKDDGYLLVSHPDLNCDFGLISQNEYNNSKDKAQLLQIVAKDGFRFFGSSNATINFTGKFKEPVIEKVAYPDPVVGNPYCTNCKKEMAPAGETAGYEHYICEDCDVEGHVPPVKRSWLTASINKEVRGPFFQDLNFDKQMEIWNTVAEHFSQEGLRGQELEDEVDNFINVHNDGDSLAAISEGRWRELEAAKIAIKEDMPMASSADHLAQSLQLEDQKVASAQEKVKTEVVNALTSMLHAQGYGTAKVVDVSETKTGFDIMATVDSDGALKAVSIPVEIKEGKVILPKKSLIASLVSNGLDLNARLSEEFGKTVLARIEAEEARIAYEQEEVNQIIAERPTVTKTAGDEPKTQFEGTNETVYLNKHLIPADVADLDIGNVVHVDGVSYKLVSKDKDALSKGEDDASTWVFEKVQPVVTETSKKEKEVNK